MKAYPTASLIHHFSHIEDPRINRHKKHRLSDIFFITICATICGADNWVAIETFGKAKREWFTQLLNLENGIPSHDTPLTAAAPSWYLLKLKRNRAKHISNKPVKRAGIRGHNFSNFRQ